MINELQPNKVNTNIYNVYDYNDLTMNELLSTFFTKINELVKEQNDIHLIVEYLKNSGLEIETVKVLSKWLEDGTIENIINKEIFDDLHKAISYYDLSQNPILYTGVRGKETSVMQDFHILKNGNVLMSQIAPISTAEKESFTVSLTTVKGDVINSMTIRNGGHGNFTAHETDCGNIEIFYSDTNNDFRKMVYIAGVRDNEESELMYKATNERVYAKINKDDNVLALTMKNNQGEYYCTSIYDLKKYLSGESYKPLHHVSHGTLLATFQGTAVDKNNLYLYYGLVNELIQIKQINLHTLESEIYEFPKIVNSTVSENQTTEAEGACIANGVLYIGVCLGEPTVLRENNIYAFLPVNKIMSSLSTILNNTQLYKLTEASGTVKSFKHNNVIANINSPGEYYFTAIQFQQIQDIPEYLKKVESGYFLHVSAKAKDGAVVQTLTRNTAGNNRFVVSRSLSVDKVASKWKPMTPERKTLYSGNSKELDSITLTDNIWDFDFINVRIAHNGGFISHQIFLNDIRSWKRMIFHGHNLTDSDTTTFYPWELQCTISEDGLTINYDLKNELEIKPGSTIKRKSLVGIQNIQAVRGFNALP